MSCMVKVKQSMNALNQVIHGKETVVGLLFAALLAVAGWRRYRCFGGKKSKHKSPYKNHAAWGDNH